MCAIRYTTFFYSMRTKAPDVVVRKVKNKLLYTAISSGEDLAARLNNTQLHICPNLVREPFSMQFIRCIQQ